MDWITNCHSGGVEPETYGTLMHDATSEEDQKNACSPVLRNVQNSPKHGELVDSFEGCTTAWEVVARSFQKFPERDSLGGRALLKREMEPDEKTGKKFEKLTLAKEYKFLSYKQLEERVCAVAGGLTSVAGVMKGSRVLIFAETQQDWMVTALACWRQGATVVTAYATLGEEGVSTSCTQTGASVCVCDAKLFKILAKAAPRCVPLIVRSRVRARALVSAGAVIARHSGFPHCSLTDESHRLGRSPPHHTLAIAALAPQRAPALLPLA